MRLNIKLYATPLSELLALGLLQQ